MELGRIGVPFFDFSSSCSGFQSQLPLFFQQLSCFCRFLFLLTQSFRQIQLHSLHGRVRIPYGRCPCHQMARSTVTTKLNCFDVFFKMCFVIFGFLWGWKAFQRIPGTIATSAVFFFRDLGTIGTLGTTGAFQTGSTVNRSIVISQLSTSIYLLSIRSIRILGLCRFLFFDSFWLCQDMVSFSERHGVCIKGFKASSEKLLILAGSWWDNHRSNAFTSGTERCVFASFIPVELKLQWMWKNIDTCTYHITVHT